MAREEGFVPLFRQRAQEQHGEPGKGHLPLPKLPRTRAEGESEREDAEKRGRHALREGESKRRKLSSAARERSRLRPSSLRVDPTPLTPCPPGDAEDSARTPKGLLLRKLREVSGGMVGSPAAYALSGGFREWEPQGL